MGIVDFASNATNQVQQQIDQARAAVADKLKQIPSAGLGVIGNIKDLIDNPTIPNSGGNAAVPFSGSNADTSSQSNQTGGKIAFTPSGNPLNAFDQSTYSIRFSMLSGNSNNKNEVVIAESGKTNLNIESLVMVSHPSPATTNRSAPASEFTLKIYEPYGAILPDLLIAGAKQVSSSNYMKGPWKLAVSFKGYDPVTGQPNESILDRNWSWTVAMIELKSKIDERGSMHTLTFTPQDQIGYLDQFCKFPEAFGVPINKGETIGIILNRIISSMNDKIKKNYNSAYIEYSIDQISYPHPVGGINSPFDHKINSNDELFKSQRNADTVQISSGTALMAVIDNLFAASPTAAAMAASASRDHDNDPKKNVDVVSVFHTVESQVTILDYNENFGDYNKKIKYIIHPYETVRLVTNKEQANNITDPVKNQAKAAFVVNNKYLSKVYDYIFTGLNTEVLKFDIELNFQWTMATDMDFGQIHSDGTTVGKAPAPTASRNTDTNNSDAGKPTTQTPTANVAPNSTPTLTYVDDLAYKAGSPFNVSPITLSQQGNSNRVQTSLFVGNDFTKQRSMYGMLLNQLSDGGGTQTSMISIQLEIRGDPYWLGSDQSDKPTGHPINQQTTQQTPASSSANQSANYPAYLNGDYIFLLRFNIPQGFNEDTGNASVVASEMYSGFYTCYQVQHSFKDGAFTQTLYGTRILGMQVSDLLNITYGGAK